MRKTPGGNVEKEGKVSSTGEHTVGPLVIGSLICYKLHRVCPTGPQWAASSEHSLSHKPHSSQLPGKVTKPCNVSWRPSEFSNIRSLGQWLWIHSIGEHHVLVSLWLHTLSLCAHTLFPPLVPFFSLTLGYIENAFSSNYHAYSFCFPPHLPMALSSANHSLISQPMMLFEFIFLLQWWHIWG